MTAKTGGEPFAALGLEPRLTAVLRDLGYEEPTPVQKRAIPVLLQGRDLLAQAATGTGKTAAFALPLLQRLFAEGGDRTAVALLVLVPTRELAMQVAEAMHRYGAGLRLRVLPIYGGQAMSPQLQALRRGVDVVVATPGRALDHLRRRTLVLGGVRAVVLDEADEMLDMGFAEDLEAILETVPSARQTALFSATMPSRIAAIAKRHLREAAQLKLTEDSGPAGAAPRVRQAAYLVSRAQKADALSRVLDLENPTSVLVFCRTRNEVEDLARSLSGRGHRVESLHGGFTQVQRDRVMRRFREGAADLLLATDVAARGLDIRHITHVLNFDVPSAPESYVHRIGRTGRAGREGVAITLVEPRERPLLRNIERFTRQRIELLPLPTVADLRARRLELTRASLREALLRGGTDGARVVVESLAAEFDVMAIAVAAVHLVQEASERDGGSPALDEAPAVPPAPETRAQDGEKRRPAAPSPRKRPKGKSSNGDFTQIYVSAGRSAGVRPADLVGALTAGGGVAREAIGAIELDERFSLVEVREDQVDAVLEALGRVKIRGRTVTASRYRTPRTRGGKAARS